MAEKTLEDVQALLKQKGASESTDAQIRIWNYKELFTSENELKNLQTISRKRNCQICLKKINGVDQAIKVRKQGRSETLQQVLFDFYQEIESLTAFQDQRILNLQGVALSTEDEDNIQLCCITNYQPKGNLKDIIKNKQLFTEEQDASQKLYKKLILILKISEILQVIHRNQLSHKYLSTQIILLDENYNPKLKGLKSVEYVKQFLIGTNENKR